MSHYIGWGYLYSNFDFFGNFSAAIHEIKRDVRERMYLGHHWGYSIDNDGRHRPVVLRRDLNPLESTLRSNNNLHFGDVQITRNGGLFLFPAYGEWSYLVPSHPSYKGCRIKFDPIQLITQGLSGNYNCRFVTGFSNSTGLERLDADFNIIDANGSTSSIGWADA